jgi:hypothetical protein
MRSSASPERAVRVFDPDTGHSVRAGGGLPDIAVDLNPGSPGYGNLYAAWGDSFGSAKTNGKVHSTVVFTKSTDGGRTWSPLARIDKSPDDVQAFTPSVHVASDGTVGVTYYDSRNDTPDAGLPTDEWFVHCHPTSDCTDPANWAENHVDGSFDIENAPTAGGYFLGDYEGLASIGTTFTSFFSETTPTDKDNSYPGDDRSTAVTERFTREPRQGARHPAAPCGLDCSPITSASAKKKAAALS